MAENNTTQDAPNKVRRTHEPYGKRKPVQVNNIARGEGYNTLWFDDSIQRKDAQTNGGGLSGWSDRKDLINAVMEDTNFSSKKAADVVDAIRMWTTDAVPDIQKETQMGKKWANDIEDFIAAAPKVYGKLFRGSEITEQELGKYYKMKNDKTVFSDNAIRSWSTRSDVAVRFAKGGDAEHDSSKKIKVTFRLVGGVMRGTPIAHLSMIPDQSEVIVSKKQKYRVERIERDANEYDELGGDLTGKGYKMFRIYVRAV